MSSAPDFSDVERLVAGVASVCSSASFTGSRSSAKRLDRVLVRLGDVGLGDLADVVGLGLGAEPGVLELGDLGLDARQLRGDVVGDMGGVRRVPGGYGRGVAGRDDIGRGMGILVLVGHRMGPKGAVVAILRTLGSFRRIQPRRPKIARRNRHLRVGPRDPLLGDVAGPDAAEVALAAAIRLRGRGVR